MKTAFIVGALVSAAAATPLVARDQNWSWSSCNSGDPVKINSVSVSPDPIEKGTTLKVQGTGTTSETVYQGSTIDLSVSTYGFDVYSHSFDLCDELSELSGTTCPVQKGNVAIAAQAKLPSDTPSGTYNIKATAKNADGSELTCLNIKVSL